MKSIVVIAVFFVASTYAASWDYGDEHGPDTWPDTWPTCGGKNQSPINVVEEEAKYKDMSVVLEGYSTPIQWDMSNNGHTVQASVPAGNLGTFYMDAKDTYNFADHRWSLLQLHFHWDQYNDVGSENTLEGKAYPMEAHFVHANNKYTVNHTQHSDGLLVLGFFFEVGAENLGFNRLFQTIPLLTFKGNTTVSQPFAPSALFSGSVESNEFFAWRGSLTTPGCAEAVSWHLFKQPIQISQSQMDMVRYSLFENEKGEDDHQMKMNWRPVQPLNARNVYHNIKAPAPTDPPTQTPPPPSCGAEGFRFSLLTVAAAIFLNKIFH